MLRPLADFRILELAGIGPGPYAGQLLADLGAEVICIERPGRQVFGYPRSTDRRGKKSIVIDLSQMLGAQLVLSLAKEADMLFECNRPGVAERLGIGPAQCHEVNPKLVYGRLTGWGQTGPWARTAGHDINYISITGALEAMGDKDAPPAPPLNFVGDYGGGTMNLIMGAMAALLRAQKTGHGDVIDAAIIDGVSSMMGIVHSLDGLQAWTPHRQNNLLDGGAPFYRCYQTLDQRFMAVGCLEPQFFQHMISILQLNANEYGEQYDRSRWLAQCQILESVFAVRTRDEWAEIFDGTDACVTPVLNYQEARSHPQNIARGGLNEYDGMIHARTIPVLASCPREPEFAIPAKGGHTHEILTDMGLVPAEIKALVEQNIVGLD